MVKFQSATDRAAGAKEVGLAALLREVARFIQLVSVSLQLMLLCADGS